MRFDARQPRPRKCIYDVSCITLLKIKVLHDAIEEPFCLNGSIKNLSVSQKVLCGERMLFRL